MANVKISGLPAASAVADANEFEINEAGISKKVTGSQIASYVETEIGALTSSDLGTTVQPYDVDTAKYDATTANFTGTLQNGGSNVVVDTDIGSTVQAYDADTTKNDVSNTFTANQIISVTDNSNAALRITQEGTGNAIVVEDSTNPDSTPLVVSASGALGVGTNSPSQKLHVKSDQIIVGTVESTNADFSRLQFKNANTTNSPYIGSFNNELRLNSTGTSIVLQDGATEKMRLTASGGVAFNGASNYGTTGQILTSNGDAPPTWADASGGGGAWDVLNVTDITSTTNTIIWDFSTWSSYETFKLIIAQAKPSTDNADLILEWGDNGASFSSNRDGNESVVYPEFVGGATSDAHVICSDIGTAAGEEGAHGELTFMGFNQSGLRGYVFGAVSRFNGDAETNYISQATLTDAENSIRLSMGAALNETYLNFVDGTFTLLGLKTS